MERASRARLVAVVNCEQPPPLRGEEGQRRDARSRGRRPAQRARRTGEISYIKWLAGSRAPSQPRGRGASGTSRGVRVCCGEWGQASLGLKLSFPARGVPLAPAQSAAGKPAHSQPY
eukprot:scaffold3664_cov407-Prasinococcus_capsulatus_cf.AAC.13